MRSPATRHGRDAAISVLGLTGLAELPPIGLQGIDTARVAVAAGHAHAPDCRHCWPVLCRDADGWLDRRLTRSP